MKTLRKVSFENFERLTIVEASQLYGGTGGNPPTTPLPTDSIPPNRNDSIPPTQPPVTPKNEINSSIETGKNGNTKITFEYTRHLNNNSDFSTKAWVDSNGNYGITGTYKKKF